MATTKSKSSKPKAQPKPKAKPKAETAKSNGKADARAAKAAQKDKEQQDAIESGALIEVDGAEFRLVTSVQPASEGEAGWPTSGSESDEPLSCSERDRLEQVFG